MDITTADLLASLAGTTCPACARLKRAKQTVCRGCYNLLPIAERNDLYNPLGGGYLEAVQAAMKRLKATKFNLPVQA